MRRKRKTNEMQMNKARGFLLAVAAAAMGFTFSCSSDIETAEGIYYAYCIKDGYCLEGPFAFSDCVSINGSPSNSCTVAPSSSSLSSSSSLAAVSTCGADFRTVTIGTQVWAAENLNCDVAGSKCYDDDPANCDKYGRLYNWSTAKTACPPGWHLPTQAEWNTLSSYVQSDSGCSSCDARLLKATSGWNSGGNSTDKYGFSALPGGYGYSDGSFYGAGYNGNWWSASEGGSSGAYFRYMYYYYEYATWDYDIKSSLFSVRCLQD